MLPAIAAFSGLCYPETVAEPTTETASRIVGREAAIASIRDFLAPTGSRRALLVKGEAGIGKTTIWEAGIAAAEEGGLRVLSARPSDAEAKLPFAALGDLLDAVDGNDLASLPTPQRQAVEVALLRAEPGGTPPEQRAIAFGFLNALRHMADQRPLLVAVDDVQWLDHASAHALAFATRRLSGVQVRFLLAQRSGISSSLVDAFEPIGLERLAVDPLSSGALRRLLFLRLGLSLTRRVLRQVTEAAQGNPLFALEMGRAIVERGPPGFGAELSVPDSVEDLLGTRVSQLRSPVRKVLMAVALCSTLRIYELEAVANPTAIDEAVDAGLLLLEGDSVRASHPLLAAAAMQHSRTRERREVPLALAAAVGDEQLRAALLAVATKRPDDKLAATIATAAAGAARRGAADNAVLLAEHALRLTPPESAERSGRLLALAEFLSVVGESKRVTDLLSAELATLPSGRMKAEALLLLSGAVRSYTEIRKYQALALAESRSDPGLYAEVAALMCAFEVTIRLEGIREATVLMRDSFAAAHEAGAATERMVLYALGWANGLRGTSIDDICGRFRDISADGLHVSQMPERVAGQRLVWRGDADQARALLTRLLSLADEQGQSSAYALLRLHICELELRLGEWAAAEQLLAEWEESSDRGTVVWPMYERCRALLAAGRGLPAEAEHWAVRTIALAEDIGNRWDLFEAQRARGIAALLAGEPGRAAESLRPVWEHTQREGIDEPGAFPVAPDLVEALIELGELDEARSVTARLRDLSRQQEHPWGRATTKRCEALIRLGSDPGSDARSDLAEAAADYGKLGLRFDRARCFLALGRAERRHKKWGASRVSLEQAAAAFEEIGSAGWVEQARSELARVGARRPQAEGTLTPSEQHVASLAAEGLANKEIAAVLHVGVHTVEVHLSRAYTKLGIRSRSQLAGKL